MRIQKTFLPVIRSPWWLVLWDVKFHWRSVCGYKFFFSKSRLLLTMAWFAKICPKNIMALLVIMLGPFNRWSLGDFTKMEGTQREMFNFLWLIWDHYLPLTPTKTPLTPTGWGANLPKSQIYYIKPWTQKYPCTCSNFLFPADLGLRITFCWCSISLEHVNEDLGQQTGKISHRKMNISIWVPSILVKSPKDCLLC